MIVVPDAAMIPARLVVLTPDTPDAPRPVIRAAAVAAVLAAVETPPPPPPPAALAVAPLVVSVGIDGIDGTAAEPLGV